MTFTKDFVMVSNESSAVLLKTRCQNIFTRCKNLVDHMIGMSLDCISVMPTLMVTFYE